MSLKKIGLILMVLFGSVGCDQVTKAAARHYLEGQGRLSYLGDTFRLTLAENHGAFLGMGGSLPPMVRTIIFTVLVGGFLLGLLIWMFRSKEMSTLGILSISLLVGGGVGNLIDRVLNNGGVTDFLNLGIGTLRTGIFNVADLWIVFGAVLLLFAKEFRDKPPAPQQAEG